MTKAVPPFTFSGGEVVCSFETTAQCPLIVSPASGKPMDFCKWVERHQTEFAEAIKQFGAVVVSGFGLTKDQFHPAFKRITLMDPAPYKGDTPRDELGHNIYKSTAVNKEHHIHLHQEESYIPRDQMPKYISFFCVTPPAKGTGRTLVGSVKKVSEAIQQRMPTYWQRMKESTVTYIARYLPSNSLHTRWIQYWNSSHATIQKQFKTQDKAEIERQCAAAGLTCTWEKSWFGCGEWLKTTRKGIPATIDHDGTTLFCNAIYNSKLSPQLCKGKCNYILARIILYPFKSFMQFDAEFDSGPAMDPTEAGSVIPILEEHEVGRDWKAGDLMICDNVTTMHGKTPHNDNNRDIMVAMCGSATAKPATANDEKDDQKTGKPDSKKKDN